MPGFDGQVCWYSGINLSDTTSSQFSHPNQMVTDGQLIIGATASPNMRIATLTAGAGMVITNGAGTISVSAGGPGGAVTWSNIGASQALVVQNGYFCSTGGALSLSLPTTAAVGSIIEIVLQGSTSFTITQAAGQSIKVNGVSSTVGVAGSVASTAAGNAIKLVCMTANTTYVATSFVGILTIV